MYISKKQNIDQGIREAIVIPYSRLYSRLFSRQEIFAVFEVDLEPRIEIIVYCRVVVELV